MDSSDEPNDVSDFSIVVEEGGGHHGRSIRLDLGGPCRDWFAEWTEVELGVFVHHLAEGARGRTSVEQSSAHLDRQEAGVINRQQGMKERWL